MRWTVAVAVAILLLSGCAAPAPGSPGSPGPSASPAADADPGRQARTGADLHDATTVVPIDLRFEPMVDACAPNGQGGCTGMSAGAVPISEPVTIHGNVTAVDLRLSTDPVPLGWWFRLGVSVGDREPCGSGCQGYHFREVANATGAAPLEVHAAVADAGEHGVALVTAFPTAPAGSPLAPGYAMVTTGFRVVGNLTVSHTSA